MNIVEEFFIKYGTDAKQARADIDALDKAIAGLAEKGNKRTESEQNQLKALRKLRTDHIKDLRDTTDQTDKLGTSFYSMAGQVAAGLGIFTGAVEVLKKIKDGVVGVIDYNFELQKTSKLTGISAHELAVWDKAVQQAGGSAGEFLGYISKLNEQYAALGVNDRIKFVTRDFLTLAKAWEGLTDSQRLQRATQLGLTPGEVLLLDQGYQKVTQILAQQEKLVAVNERTAKASVDIKNQWANIGTEFQSTFTKAIPAAKVFLTVLEMTANTLAAILDIAGAIVNVPFIQGLLKGAGWVGEKLSGGAYDQASPTTPKSTLGAPTGSGSASSTLSLISQYESGNRNVPNASGPGGTPASTASGYYQILNGTWRQFAPQAGVDLSQYPTAMSAPFDVQTRVASLIYSQQGLAPWASDSRLMAAVAAGAVGEANQSPINSTTSSSSNALSIGSVTINTQATDAGGIARDFNGSMQKEYSQTIGSMDDGVLY
jgi:hypothetical protein